MMIWVAWFMLALESLVIALVKARYLTPDREGRNE
jgi:hypothetical protein